jgi:pilus assembly protein Flp/PilA
MRRLGKTLVRFLAAEDGPTAVEYAVMLALIIVVCVGAVTTVGGKTGSSFTNTGSRYPVGS